MKWYSIKEYTPPSCTNVLVRVLNTKGNFSFDRYFIAMCEDFDTITDLATWELANSITSEIDYFNYTVTHFALIEPVPIYRGE